MGHKSFGTGNPPGMMATMAAAIPIASTWLLKAGDNSPSMLWTRSKYLWKAISQHTYFCSFHPHERCEWTGHSNKCRWCRLHLDLKTSLVSEIYRPYMSKSHHQVSSWNNSLPKNKKTPFPNSPGWIPEGKPTRHLAACCRAKSRLVASSSKCERKQPKP